jgi:hypothetical protein
VHERIGAPPWESVVVMQERALSAAREALGEAGFAAHAEEGRARPPEDVVADAELVAGFGTSRAFAVITDAAIQAHERGR